MTSVLDLIYKGRMNITPSSTWSIRSLVQTLKINAEDVSVISGGKKPLTPIVNTTTPNNHQSSTVKVGRKRKQTSEQTPTNSKVAKVSPEQPPRSRRKRGRQSLQPQDTSAES